MDQAVVHQTNARYWDAMGNDALGAVALPFYGPYLSEDTCQMLGDISGKNVLEIGCGNGQSLEYLGQRRAAELWGIDLSEKQLERAAARLAERGLSARLIRSPMEEECGLPTGYFDLVYSIYAIGWTTDLDLTFRRIASYLKPGGAFLFSWSHPIHKCVSKKESGYRFEKCYFDESWYSPPLELCQGTLALSDRMLSTYVNALAGAGFVIERMAEENDGRLLPPDEETTPHAERAKLLPVTFAVKARKL